MARALELARSAGLAGEVPVGALLVRDDVLVAEGHNLTMSHCDPTAHAERLVLQRAGARLGDWRLLGCTLYTTLEPCAMCAGATVLSRVPRLVFAAPDPKAGMAGSLDDLLRDPRLNHAVQVDSGVLAQASAELLRSFFRNRRVKPCSEHEQNGGEHRGAGR